MGFPFKKSLYIFMWGRHACVRPLLGLPVLVPSPAGDTPQMKVRQRSGGGRKERDRKLKFNFLMKK